RAIDSITHGIRGTPMPPWGEAVSSSELGDQVPVLSHAEIEQLTDWLYQGIPQEPRVEFKEEFEKWHYMPSDIVQEMIREKNLLEPAPNKKEPVNTLVQDYFTSHANSRGGPDEELYYIREKYYTSQNLDDAKKYFMLNCAVCHGNEGAGTGMRASTM